MTVRAIAARVALVGVSIAVALGGAEWALRRLAPELLAPGVDWALLSDFYRRSDDGVFTWPPDRQVRYVRVHGERVEYDVTFHSNDLGLVDDADYAAPSGAVRRVALVGDSFTAGYHGGRPWVPALRQSMSGTGVVLYNLGIGGAGFQQFASLLASVSQRVSFTDVVIVAISDDLLRPRWVMDVRGDEARFCLESWPRWLCRLRPPYFHRIGLTEDPAASLARARREAEGSRRSALAALLVRVVRSAERSDRERAARIAANESALAAMVRSHGGPAVSLVHLPVRGEVERGAYDDYAQDLGEKVRSLGGTYFPALYECRWDPTMFFRNDAHPNRAGYERVSACVGRFLRERVLPQLPAAVSRQGAHGG